MTTSCAICGEYDEAKHRASEQLGSLNHQWSTTGVLIPTQRDGTKRPSRPQTPILVVGAIDTALRQILLSKGILTDEDFSTVLHPGSGTEGDRGTGETPPAE